MNSEWLVSWLVGALSPVNHREDYLNSEWLVSWLVGALSPVNHREDYMNSEWEESAGCQAADSKADGARKLKERSPIDFRLRIGIFQTFSLEDRRVRDVCYVQSEAER